MVRSVKKHLSSLWLFAALCAGQAWSGGHQGLPWGQPAACRARPGREAQRGSQGGPCSEGGQGRAARTQCDSECAGGIPGGGHRGAALLQARQAGGALSRCSMWPDLLTYAANMVTSYTTRPNPSIPTPVMSPNDGMTGYPHTYPVSWSAGDPPVLWSHRVQAPPGTWGAACGPERGRSAGPCAGEGGVRGMWGSADAFGRICTL
jgi:hypothetical protein